MTLKEFEERFNGLDEDQHIRTWKEGDYRLELFDLYGQVHGGPQAKLGYLFYHNEVLIFAGDDYGCSPCHAIDSDESVGSLLYFLSLKKGDTESDYFANYTPEQLEFSEQHGEDLAMWAMELEEGPESEDE